MRTDDTYKSLTSEYSIYSLLQSDCQLLTSVRSKTTKANLTSVELLICGALSGAISKTMIAPIDRVKLLYFVSPTRNLSFTAAKKTFTTIWRATGIRGLFKGNASAMWRVIPYSGITFASYQRYREYINGVVVQTTLSQKYHKHVTDFLGGSMAGITATFFTHPLDLIRARAGAHWSLEPLYKDAMSGLVHIARTEGVRGLYAGVAPSIVGIIPYSGISFYLFERFKDLSAKLTNVPKTELHPSLRLISGGLAAAVASTLVHPLHVIRRRMQVYGVAKDTPQYTSTWQALKVIYQKEGVRRGLFKGLLMTQLKAPIATALSFALNDSFTHHLDLAKQRMNLDTIETIKQRKELLSAEYAQECRQVVQSYEYNKLRGSSTSTDTTSTSNATSSSNTNTEPNTVTFDFYTNRMVYPKGPQDAKNEQVANDAKDTNTDTISSSTSTSSSSEPIFSTTPPTTPTTTTTTCDVTATTKPKEAKPTTAYILSQLELKHQNALSTLDFVNTITPAYQLSEISQPENILQEVCFGNYKASLSNLYKRTHIPAILTTCYDQIQALPVSDQRMLYKKYTQASDIELYSKFVNLSTNDVSLSNTALLVIGAIAGCTGKTVICPADNIKILYQVNPTKPFSLRSAVRTGVDIVSKQGWKSLWRGNSASLVRTAPYSAVTYMTYDRYVDFISTFFYKKTSKASSMPLPDKYGRKKKPTHPLVKFLAGGFAGMTATALTYPLDMIRVRMASSIWSGTNPYGSYIQGFKNVIHANGIKGLYGGLGTTLLGVFPYTGTSFMTYHSLKDGYARIMKEEAPMPLQMGFGGLAALISQSVCYPLDIVRRRKQLGMFTDMSTLQSMKHILKHEGWRNFFKSLSMNWIKGPVAAGISFMMNDQLKKMSSKYKEMSVKSL